MSTSIWLNGERIATTQLDRGLQFGDGHFTTLTRESGKLRWWPAHWQRLQEASKRLAIPLPRESDILACLTQSKAENVVFKIIITRGESDRGYGFSNDPIPNWYVTVSDLPKRKLQPLNCGIASLSLARAPFFAGLKTLNRLEQVMLRNELQQRDVDDLLVSDSEGKLIEATSSNLFLRINNTWHTPSLTHAGIAGIVRQQVLKAQPLGHILESQLDSTCCGEVQQAFLTNSVLGLRPIAQIGDHKLPEQQLPKALLSWWES